MPLLCAPPASRRFSQRRARALAGASGVCRALLAAAWLCAGPPALGQAASAPVSPAPATKPADPAEPAEPANARPCAACHGPQGNPSLALVPALAGQTARYLVLQMRDFQAGRRSHPPAAAVANGLTRDEVRALAAYFSAQRRLPLPFQPDAARGRLGKLKADETLCTVCHLGGFAGHNEIPRVAGQPFDYVVKQLRDFRSGQRSNDAGNMAAVVAALTDADIDHLAHYIAGF